MTKEPLRMLRLILIPSRQKLMIAKSAGADLPLMTERFA
jgi:hypothetical protein